MFAITYRNIFLSLGLFFMASSVVIIGVLGLNLGIDFTGGSLTEVVYEELPAKVDLENRLESLELGAFTVRDTVDGDGRAGYIIRTRDLSEPERAALTTEATSIGSGGEVARFTSIGPVIGQELRDKAVWAVSAVGLIIIFYIAFAFRGVSYPVGSWVYGGVTVFVLIHDILVPTAVMALLGFFIGIEVDVLFVMALLAVLGYSVNDTIVIFDRVRENLDQNRKEKKVKKNIGGLEVEEIEYTLTKPFDVIIGESVGQTLLRSVNTSFTTLLALIALYLFGGAVTQTFALILLAGVVAGTYSSICFASPLLSYLAERRLKSQESK
jgi:preprotein translocase subunit SecF